MYLEEDEKEWVEEGRKRWRRRHRKGGGSFHSMLLTAASLTAAVGIAITSYNFEQFLWCRRCIC